MRGNLLDLVLRHDEIAELDTAERRLALRDLLVRNEETTDVASSLDELANAIDGFGPLTDLMEDDEISDVLVNGVGDVWVERSGVIKKVSVGFGDSEELATLIERLLTRSGARVDVERPVADARLADGSRIHVVLPPVAPNGPLVSIRRFRKTAWTLEDLVATGMMSRAEADTLSEAVLSHRSVALSGGTGCGKTSLLNALLGLIGTNERVVLIEETQELRPTCPHHVELLTRAPNIEGKGAIEMQDLVRTALRMRPDRIVVGEVRGPEAAAALGAMSVGHKGSMVTIHARSAGEVVDRFVTLALLAGTGVSELSLRRQVETAFDLIVHLDRTADGKRRLVEILEK